VIGCTSSLKAATALLALLLTLGVIALVPDFFARWWLHAAFVVLILLGLHYSKQIPRSVRSALAGFMVAILIVFGSASLEIVVQNVRNLNEFDFITFWVNGRVASQGLDFYDQVHYHEAGDPF